MANIIQQFKDADGNNIFPLAYAQGGVKMDLLWTNPSLTSDFAEQDIILGDITEYEFLYIFVRGTSGNNNYLNYFFKNEVGLAQIALGYNFNEKSLRVRLFTPIANGVHISKGYNGSSESPGSTIPYQIYGVKMSYIVPTTVHGLQYIEV